MRWLLGWCLSLLFAAGDLLDTESIDEFVRSIIWKGVGAESVIPQSELPDDLHVIITDTSRFYHNYRHAINAIAMYRIVKWLGVPDSRIHLFLGECSPCDGRNPFRGEVFLESNHISEIFINPGPIEVDYRFHNVISRRWKDLLADRHPDGTPNSQRLKTTANSNLFVYVNGHGGNRFTKFQDFDELSAEEIFETIHELKLKRKFRELFLLIDSCQALTLGNDLDTDHTIVLGTSQKDENAYSCNDDSKVGLSLMDRFTFKTAKYFEAFTRRSENITINSFMKSMDTKYLLAPPDVRDDRLGKSAQHTALLSFFADPKLYNSVDIGSGPVKKSKGVDPIKLAYRYPM